MNTKRRMSFCFVAVIVLLGMAVAVPAGAHGPNSKKLFGEYVLNLTANCAGCTGMFDTTTFGPFGANLPICPTGSSASSYTWNTQGIFNFDGRGGFEFIGRYLAVPKDPMSIVFPPPPGTLKGVLPATSMKLKCPYGSYTVEDDLTVNLKFGTMEEGCEVTAAVPTTEPIHEMFNMSMKGRLFDRMDGAILFLNDTLDPDAYPIIEKIHNVPIGGTPFDSYRICGYSGTAMILRGTRGRSK